jgi:hypothetical protein
MWFYPCDQIFCSPLAVICFNVVLLWIAWRVGAISGWRDQLPRPREPRCHDTRLGFRGLADTGFVHWLMKRFSFCFCPLSTSYSAVSLYIYIYQRLFSSFPIFSPFVLCWRFSSHYFFSCFGCLRTLQGMVYPLSFLSCLIIALLVMVLGMVSITADSFVSATHLAFR